MTDKPPKFKPLTDAADLLRGLRASLLGQKPESKNAAAPLKPREVLRSTQTVEEALQRKPVAPAKSEFERSRSKHPFPKKKNQNGRPQKQILKGPGLKAAAEKLIRAAEAEVQSTPLKPIIHLPAAINRASFDKIRTIATNTSHQIEPRPIEVSSGTKLGVQRYLDEGARAFEARPGPDLENGFIVGFDLGTSSLKLAIRQPYQAGDPVVAMPTPKELRSMEHPYLWQTALWFDPKAETFSLTPSAGMIVLAGFKGGIIGGLAGDRLVADLPITRGEAAVAFVALHLAYMLGWYRSERPLGQLGGEHFLSINIGIPVSSLDDVKTCAIFKRIVAAAHKLAPKALSLSHTDVRSALNHAPEELPDGFMIVPELTAAIAGYAAEPTSQSGSHVLVDVGASTLDIVAFNLVDRKRVAVFSSAVELLGSASLEVVCANGIADLQFKQACDHQFDQVYGTARSPERAQDGFCPSRRRKPVQLLTTGGGCGTNTHTLFIDEMPKENVLGNAPKVRPMPPASIASQECDRSRLLLAYGLTRDIQELVELKLPSQVSDVIPLGRIDHFFASKDVI